MLWIAIDESGDLGFGPKSSRYLVLAFTFTLNVEGIRKTMRRLLKKLVRKRLWPKELNELKFSLSKEKLRERDIEFERYVNNLDRVRCIILNKIQELPIDVAISIVEKKLVQNHLRRDPNKLYNYVLVHPLIVYFIPRYNPIPYTTINIVLDKRLGSRALSILKQYVSRKYDYMRSFEKRISYEVGFRLLQKPSYSEPLIWVSDYIAGSVNYYLVKRDRGYIDIIKDKLFDCLYFWYNPRICDIILGRT